jgi:hypothetical protein
MFPALDLLNNVLSRSALAMWPSHHQSAILLVLPDVHWKVTPRNFDHKDSQRQTAKNVNFTMMDMQNHLYHCE